MENTWKNPERLERTEGSPNGWNVILTSIGEAPQLFLTTLFKRGGGGSHVRVCPALLLRWIRVRSFGRVLS